MSDPLPIPTPPRRELTLEGLDAVLGLMRKHGVTQFKTAIDGSPLEVAFEPTGPKGGNLESLQPEASPCECGHPMAEHNENGECLRTGCLNKCSP